MQLTLTAGFRLGLHRSSGCNCLARQSAPWWFARGALLTIEPLPLKSCPIPLNRVRPSLASCFDKAARQEILEKDARPFVSLSLSPSRIPQNTEALISPSVSLARNRVPAHRKGASVAGASTLPAAYEVDEAPNQSGVAVPTSGADGSARSRTDTGDSAVSGSPSPADSDNDDAPAPSPSSTRAGVRRSQNNKQPLTLQRAHFRQQQRLRVRPVPRGLAIAAATAAARAAERDGPAAVASGGAGSGCNDSATTTTPLLRAGAVAAAALGADRAAGASAMRGALDGLRGERDSLADACQRIEAEREAAVAQLKEGAERVRQLERAKEELERERGVLSARCAELETRTEVCGEGECPGAVAAEGRARELEMRAAELDEARDETVQLVRAV